MEDPYADENPYASPAWPAEPPAPRPRGKYRSAAALAFCGLLLISAAAVWIPLADLPIRDLGFPAAVLVQAVAARVLVLTLEFLPAAIVLRFLASLGRPPVGAPSMLALRRAEQPGGATKSRKPTPMDRGAAIGGSIGIVLSAVPMTLCLLLDAATRFSVDPAVAASVARMLFAAVFALGFVGACIGAGLGMVLHRVA